jgi:hypothetical protein
MLPNSSHLVWQVGNNLSGSLVSTQTAKILLKFLCVICNVWLQFFFILHFVHIYITVIDVKIAAFSKIYKIWYTYLNTLILKLNLNFYGVLEVGIFQSKWLTSCTKIFVLVLLKTSITLIWWPFTTMNVTNMPKWQTCHTYQILLFDLNVTLAFKVYALPSSLIGSTLSATHTVGGTILFLWQDQHYYLYICFKCWWPILETVCHTEEFMKHWMHISMSWLLVTLSQIGIPYYSHPVVTCTSIHWAVVFVNMHSCTRNLSVPSLNYPNVLTVFMNSYSPRREA